MPQVPTRPPTLISLDLMERESFLSTFPFADSSQIWHIYTRDIHKYIPNNSEREYWQLREKTRIFGLFGPIGTHSTPNYNTFTGNLGGFWKPFFLDAHLMHCWTLWFHSGQVPYSVYREGFCEHETHHRPPNAFPITWKFINNRWSPSYETD